MIIKHLKQCHEKLFRGHEGSLVHLLLSDVIVVMHGLGKQQMSGAK